MDSIHREHTVFYGKTRVIVCENEFDLGRRAAGEVAGAMRALLAERESVRMVFAAGESQMTFLDALAAEKDIDWRRVAAFNMDEFYDPGMPETFTCFHQVKTQLYDRVEPGRVHRIRHDALDAEEEAARFAAALREEGPVDITCMGIGTSGHLAFNEPFDADFEDRTLVRVVAVAEQSKRQLMSDPNFREYGSIPERGITMTIPALLAARQVFTMVPLALKRPILTRLFAEKTPTTALPATILSTAAGTLFVDRNSCPEDLKE